MACSCGFSKGCTSVLTGSGFIAPPCVLCVLVCVLSVYPVCTLQFLLIVPTNLVNLATISIIAKKIYNYNIWYVQYIICIHAASIT